MIAIKIPASTRKTPRTVQHLALAARYSKRAWHQLIGGWVKPLENIQKKRWKITMLSMGKSTMNIAMFNSKLFNYQRLSHYSLLK